jgi:lipoprotein-anchoring transpeptidase ErfK/SrfK
LSALVVVAAIALAGCGTKDSPSLGASAATTPDGAITPDQPSDPSAKANCNQLPAGESAVVTAANEGQLAIYDQAGATTPVKTMTNPRLINNDPNAKVPVVFLVKDIPDDQNCLWVQVYLPERPNGSTGWVKATDVTRASNPYRIQVMLNEFKLMVFKDDQQINEIAIGVAKDNTPTPGGLYYTTELIKTPDPSGAYGPYAFGLSGFSDKLTTFNGGPGQLGIHGTNQPNALGTKVSHGCIRMSNENITALAQMLPLGTPVQVST